MWNSFKKFIAKIGLLDRTEGNASIQKLANLNALNRRKNARILYPHFGALGPYPKIYYMEHELLVVNISVGGLLIIDDTERFGSEVGSVVQLNFAWGDFKSPLRARVVGANLQRRHLQFVDFNAQIFLRISQLLKPGFTGSKFHQVQNESGRLAALEMWIGPTNENLLFVSGAAFAEISYGSEKIIFYRHQPTSYAKNGAPVPTQILNNLLVMFANFPHPSPRVKELLEIIEGEVAGPRQKRTGTHG